MMKFKTRAKASDFFVGQRVTTADYGREVQAVITKIGKSIVFVRVDGSQFETFRHPENIKSLPES